MKVYNNVCAQRIYELLAPMIGDLMARGTIRSKANFIGLTEETISSGDLPRLAAEIKKGLVVFLGSDGAEKLAMKISQIC